MPGHNIAAMGVANITLQNPSAIFAAENRAHAAGRTNRTAPYPATTVPEDLDVVAGAPLFSVLPDASRDTHGICAAKHVLNGCLTNFYAGNRASQLDELAGRIHFRGLSAGTFSWARTAPGHTTDYTAHVLGCVTTNNTGHMNIVAGDMLCWTLPETVHRLPKEMRKTDAYRTLCITPSRHAPAPVTTIRDIDLLIHTPHFRTLLSVLVIVACNSESKGQFGTGDDLLETEPSSTDMSKISSWCVDHNTTAKHEAMNTQVDAIIKEKPQWIMALVDSMQGLAHYFIAKEGSRMIGVAQSSAAPGELLQVNLAPTLASLLIQHALARAPFVLNPPT